jgi:nucleotide-binding universal stress UspA family protein
VKRFVVGVTTAETAQKAAIVALELATAVGATVHFVSAVKDNETTVIGAGDDRSTVDGLSIVRNEIERLLAEMGTQVTYTVRTVEGDPAKALISEAERIDADLIVVGNVRMQGMSRILGSVGNDVSHNAPCNVLIVKTAEG